MAGLASDVSLQIYVKLSSVDGADVKSSDNDITTAEREVETNVAVTDRKALVISGPNTGGKSVALKNRHQLRRKTRIVGHHPPAGCCLRGRGTDRDRHRNAVDAGALNPEMMAFDL